MTTQQGYDEDRRAEVADLSEEEQEARRLKQRENVKRVLQESGLASMLRDINKYLLKGRGHFEEYDSFLLLRWGTIATARHLWIEVEGDHIRFRLLQHRKCIQAAPQCDGEYHTFTREMWSDHNFLQAQLKKYYDRPVAETSSD